MNNYYTNTRPEVAHFMPEDLSSAKILEIGCGAGLFRKNVRNCSEYWGIELDGAMANNASTMMDKVLTGTFEAVYDQLPDAYFDCVICNDVIEHMADENKFLQIIKRKIKGDAVLVGSIPNVRYIYNLTELMLSKDWRYRDAGILDRTHLRFFTQKSLLRTFKENGYKIDEFGGINEVKINREKLRFFLRSLRLHLAIYLLGTDTKYQQFGFRISQAHGRNGSRPPANNVTR